MPTATDGITGGPEVQELKDTARLIRVFLNQILSDQNIHRVVNDQPLREDVRNAWAELAPSMTDEIIEASFLTIYDYERTAVGLTGAQLRAKLNALRSALAMWQETGNASKALELSMMLWGSLAAILKLTDWAEAIKEFLELIKALRPE